VFQTSRKVTGFRVPRIALAVIVIVGGFGLGVPSSSPAADPALAAESSSASDCQGPLVITRGGSYAGCWSSGDPATLAVRIATSEPVELRDCRVSGSGLLVSNSVPNVKLAVRNCVFQGLYPGQRGRSGSYAMLVTSFDYLDVQHNLVVQKGGFKAIDWSGEGSVPAVTVKFNRARNIDGRHADGAGGYLDDAAGRDLLQFVQLDKVNGPGIEIAWNEVVNWPFSSNPEDNISVYKSGGTPGSPLLIHDNYIEGAYPPDPSTDRYYGGGILVGDEGGAWSVVRDNIVVAPTNYGVAIAGGTNNVLRGNRVVSSGQLSDGRPIAAQNVGVYVWNNSAPAAWGNNSAFENVAGLSKPGKGRNDWWLPDCTGRCDNTHFRPQSQAVTREDEKSERVRWRDRLAAAGATVGP
jgi:hypothetical protein